MTPNKFDDITGKILYDSSGDKIGTIKELYLDESGEEPKWATVSSGIFGTKRHFVPLEGISMHEEGLVTPYDKESILDAPRLKAEEDLSEADEDRLYSHYSMDQQAGRVRLRRYIVTEVQPVDVPAQPEAGRDSKRKPAFGEVPKPAPEEEERLH